MVSNSRIAHFFFDTALEHPDEGDTLWRKRFLPQKKLQHQQRGAQWFAKSVFDQRNKFGIRSFARVFFIQPHQNVGE